MADFKYASLRSRSLLPIVAIALCAMTAVAQSATDSGKPTHVIPLVGDEPAAKIVIDCSAPL